MVKACAICVTVIAAVSFGVFFSGSLYFSNDDEYFTVFVNPKEILFETDEKFLSVALDAVFMRCDIHVFTDGDWEKLEELSRLLSPAYIRMGGNDADLLVFSFDNIAPPRFNTSFCEDFEPHEEITVTGDDWLKLNKFVHNSNLSLIFDLNVLLRKNSHWDDTNARQLLKFSENHTLPLDFQLGNEPNSFPHKFNITLTGQQLAHDFYNLRKLLNSSVTYLNSKLIGPDVTRPKNLESSSLKFLDEFLSKGDIVDVVSWHQYYLNGHNASFWDFVNPETFDVLPPQIEAVLRTVRRHFSDKPVWISETSSAYGGGAPGLSDRFVASFLWLDKLGVAARSNISVVIRQSLFKNHYALIGNDFSPNPDFWISVLYRHLVGRRVLNVTVTTNMASKLFRFYGHCLAVNSSIDGSIVIYGMNLSNRTETFVPIGISISYPIHAFVFTPKFNDLRTRTVLLNDRELHNVTEIEDLVKMAEEVKYPLIIPPYAIGFWVLKEATETACKS